MPHVDLQQTSPFAMHTLADVCDEYCLEEPTPKANLTKLPRLPVLGLERLQSLRTIQGWSRAGIALDLAQRARALALKLSPIREIAVATAQTPRPSC
jgi:hypothetical protein